MTRSLRSGALQGGLASVAMLIALAAMNSALGGVPSLATGTMARAVAPTEPGVASAQTPAPAFTLTTATFDNADRELQRAQALLCCSDIFSERGFLDYQSELRRVVDAWMSLTPDARSDDERVQHLLAHAEQTAGALSAVATHLALARERLANSVDNLASWTAIRRCAGDDEQYAEIPARFLVDTPVTFADDSPMDGARIQSWLDLNEV